MASEAQGDPLHRGEAAPAPVPTTLNLRGTSGKDTFEFIAAASPAAWIVKVNGVRQAVNSQLTAVNFDGLGGADTVRITGTTRDESVELWPDHVIFRGTGLTVTATHVENVVANSGGGNDTATFHDSAGSDALLATPVMTRLSGAGFLLEANRFKSVRALSTSGNDTAKLYRGAKSDQLIATATDLVLTGPAFSNRVSSFKKVSVYSPEGAFEKLYYLSLLSKK